MSFLRCLHGAKDNSCIALFDGIGDTFIITVVDAETEQSYDKQVFDAKNMKQFIKNIPQIFGKKLKAVFLEFSHFYGHNYKSNFDLCIAFQEKLNFLGIPHFFTSYNQYTFTTLILGANINLEFCDTIICGNLSPMAILFVIYEYTENGYKQINDDLTEFDVRNKESIDEICKKIADYCKLHKFVIFENDTENLLTTFLKNKLKFKNLIFVDTDDAKFLVEATKWLFNKSYTKNYVIPTCITELSIMNSATEVVLCVEEDEILPVTKSMIIPKSLNILLQCEFGSEKSNNTIHKMHHDCHRTLITVSVDAENFLKFRTEPILLPQIKFWPAYLNETVKSKIPVIGFCDNFSVICVYKENGYKFMDEWNGIYGKELVINFCKPSPLYCEQALAASKSTVSYDFNKDGNIFKIQEPKKPIFGASKKNPYSASNEKGQFEPGSLVYDIITIMAMPADNIRIQNSWGFRITKDEKNPVLLEFMNHEKNFKQASPAFLMALMIKEKLKVIKKEIGEKPTKLGFCILDEAYGGNEHKERIMKGTEDACEMLKINCEFY